MSINWEKVEERRARMLKASKRRRRSFMGKFRGDLYSGSTPYDMGCAFIYDMIERNEDIFECLLEFIPVRIRREVKIKMAVKE